MLVIASLLFTVSAKTTGIHYYDFDASFSHRAFRLAAGYGRNYECLVFSGGVCCYQPAFTGGSFQLTYRFLNSGKLFEC